jgi:hypothetical protein
MQSLNFRDFLEIYDDPYWEESIPGGLAAGSVPTEFDIQQLYQGALVELEHTPDPYVAIEIAMDHLTEDPSYYRKLKVMEEKAARYYRNPKSYDEMSHGELKREERRLLETIDDYRYFKEDPQKIEILENQLVLVRQALAPGEQNFFSRTVPETAIQEQLIVIYNEIKTIKSLEKTAWDEGDMIKANRYRRKGADLEDTVKAIKPLLQKIVSGRSEISALENNRKKINLELIETEQKIRDLAEKMKTPANTAEVSMSHLKDREDLEQQIRSLRSAIYQQERALGETHKKINIALDIARRDLEGVGYGIQVIRAMPASAPVIPTQVIESLTPTPTPAPTSLPSELSNVYTQLSADPAIASLQNQLRDAVQDLTEAIEGRDPPHIVKRIEAKIAKLHEEIERRTAKRHRHYY